MHIKRLLVAVGLFQTACAMPANSVETRAIEARSLPTLTWDFSLPGADEQYQKILKAWPHVIVMIKFLHMKVDAKLYDTVLKNYFKEEWASSVESAWRIAMGAKDQNDAGDGTGNPAIRKIVLTNMKTPGEPCDENKNTLAWLDPIQGKDTAVMRICDKGWKFPLLGETKCDELGDTVSGKMSTIEGIIIHELMHFDTIGKYAAGTHITDHGAEGYGCLNTRKLAKKEGTEDILNADQYRWMAQEYYWSVTCQKSFKEPTSNSDYLQCQDTCTIQ